MTDQLDFLKPALSDRYTIERELGRGGMAVVYLARDEKLGRQVALKVLRPELAASLGTERFLREIEIAAKLTHPNILALHDCGEADGQLYYTMPHVEGESLREKLAREKQLSIEDALQITKEVADALGHAHSLGIVHRDLKPENILFTAGHAVVSDFGIARAVTEAGGEKLTETGITVGTPAYMSPEQATGEQDIDARSDLYSLGCVLYEMLSGDAPYTASTPQAVLAKKQSEPTPRISVVRETVPAGVEATLTKVLQQNPADRFVTAQQLVEALQAPSLDVASRRGGEGDRRRLAWYWGVGVAAVVVVVAVGLMLFDGWRSGAATAAANDIDRLVVAPLENRTGDSSAADWGLMAAEYITRAVDGAAVVAVVPASAARDLMRDVDPAVGMSLDEIARRTKARYAVTGSYALSGDRLRFDVELVNAETGELERSLETVSGPVDSLEVVFALLAERVTAATAGRLSPDLELTYTRLYSTPPTLDALEGMLEMQEAFCSRRYPEMLGVAQPVLEENPDFAPMLVPVAIALGTMGRPHEADSVLARVEHLTTQVTAVERNLGQWYHGFLHGDWAEATRAGERLYQIHPTGYGYQAGAVAMYTNRFAEALERFLTHDLETPCYRRWAPWWSMTASAYYMLERPREALDVARAGLERFPAHRPLIFFEQVALAGLGELVALDSVLDHVADLPARDRSIKIYSPGSQAAEVALELRVLERVETSERVMDRAEAWFAALPTDSLRFYRGQMLYWAERWYDADTLFAALTAVEPDNVNYRGYRGVALAHLGRREEAMETARWLEQVDRPYLRGAHTRWRAAIAAALGERGAAVRLLHQAYDEGMQLGYFFRRDPEWRPLYDYGPYQDFVRSRD